MSYLIQSLIRQKIHRDVIRFIYKFVYRASVRESKVKSWANLYIACAKLGNNEFVCLNNNVFSTLFNTVLSLKFFSIIWMLTMTDIKRPINKHPNTFPWCIAWLQQEDSDPLEKSTAKKHFNLTVPSWYKFTNQIVMYHFRCSPIQNLLPLMRYT